MHRQVGDLVFDEHGLAKRGLLVRHLVMPNLVEEGKQILKFLAEEVSKDTYVNVMEQYRSARERRLQRQHQSLFTISACSLLGTLMPVQNF